MTRFLPCLLLFLWGCQHKDDLTLPDPLDPAPFHAPREVRLNAGTGVDIVEIGAPVALLWEPGGLVQYLWTLQGPAGSAAVLSDPAAARPTFVPDVEGEYLVGLTTSIGPTVVDSAAKRLLAAAYLGRADCATCHPARASATDETAHGTTLERRAAELFATPGCLNCHVIGSNANLPVPVAGGFDDESARIGFDPQTYVFTDFASFQADFPTLADRGAVQCESCHGPGSLHEGDPRTTNVSTDARVCGACHNAFGPRFKQWQLSVHAAPPPDGTADDPSCVRCHTARGFARAQAGLVPREEGADAPGVTCAACHDPHSADNPSELRLFGDVALGDGSTYGAGRAATCVTCHGSEVASPEAHANQGKPFPCAIQAEMVAGRGAIEYGLTFDSSFHSDPGFKPRNLTGNPDDPLVPEACVTCHMAPTPATAPFKDRFGGHTWRMRDGDAEHAVGNCDRCHPGLTTFDRNVGRDFDGSGLAEGMQTEIRSLVEILHDALVAADAQQGLSRPGGPATAVTVSEDLALTTLDLRQAAYNYNFVVTDGSFGVHNTVYAVQLLQRTYEQLTGVPFATAFPLAHIP